MGFFARRDDPDAVQAESLKRIEAGGIPLGSEERLKTLSSEGTMFTSGLSVNEFALLGRLGPRPLAQVMGASVVQTGWQYLPALDPGTIITYKAYGPSVTGTALQNPYTEASPSQVRNYRWRAEVVCELDVLTDAWNLARRRALDRLAEEALQVGADAVVGVHLRRSEHDLAKGTIEYVVNGTAIRTPGADVSAWPTLTDISVQDYWRLRCAGHDAAGLLASTAVVFASPPRRTRIQRARTQAQNQELEELSHAFHAARDTVRARLLGQVSDAHATGAVGVQFDHEIRREKFELASSLQSTSRQGWHLGRLGLPYKVSGGTGVVRRGWMIAMHAAGTAVRPGTVAPDQSVKTSMRMSQR